MRRVGSRDGRGAVRTRRGYRRTGSGDGIPSNATPNIAAATGPTPATIISAQREGSNFRLKVKAPTGKTIDTVMIGDVTAKFSKQFEEYTARLSNESDNTQAVFITYTDGTTYTTSVTFRP